MFGSDIIDVAIGMCLIFLMASLICTAIQEGFEGMLKMRAADLAKGIRELLNDPDGSGIVKALYDHPMIYSLFKGEYDPSKHKNLPSYIPAASFSSALIDIVARGGLQQPNSPYPTPGAGLVPTVAQLRSAVQTLPSERLQRALLVAIDQAKGDMDAVKTNLETYFNASMDRVSGWYKKRTQIVLFFIGLVMAGALNIDAIYVANRLGQDKALRQAVVSQAEKMVPDGAQAAALTDLQKKSFEQLRGQLTGIGLPVGWSWPPRQYTNCEEAKPATAVAPQVECPSGKLFGVDHKVFTGAYMVVGWFITAFAVMLGAPFWFDALSKLMTVRSTVKPKTEAAADKPEDKPAAAPGKPPTKAAMAAAAAAAPSLPEVEFEPHSWATGSKDKGVL